MPHCCYKVTLLYIYRKALEEVKHDLAEKQYRWQQVESMCHFSIISNPGIKALIQSTGHTDLYRYSHGGESYFEALLVVVCAWSQPLNRQVCSETSATTWSYPLIRVDLYTVDVIDGNSSIFNKVQANGDWWENPLYNSNCNIIAYHANCLARVHQALLCASGFTKLVWKIKLRFSCKLLDRNFANGCGFQ